MNKKGQVLIFVFFLVLIAGIFSASLASLWQGEIKMKGQARYSTIAFYLAQAAVERGKVEVLAGYWPPPSGTFNINNQTELDDSSDNFQFFYDIAIDNSGAAGTRTIRGVGRVLDLANNEIARREIEVIVENIIDGDADGQDDDMSGTIQAFSWREI